MNEKKEQASKLIDQKLDRIAALLKEIDEIGKSVSWILTSIKADKLLEQVNEWRGSSEFDRKIPRPTGTMDIDELKKRCQQVDWSPHAQAWVEEHVMTL